MNLSAGKDTKISPCTLRLLTPALLTRSLPLARPSRACGFAHIPFAASQAAQVSFGEERENYLVDHLPRTANAPRVLVRGYFPSSFQDFEFVACAKDFRNLNGNGAQGTGAPNHRGLSMRLNNSERLALRMLTRPGSAVTTRRWQSGGTNLRGLKSTTTSEASLRDLRMVEKEFSLFTLSQNIL